MVEQTSIDARCLGVIEYFKNTHAATSGTHQPYMEKGTTDILQDVIVDIDFA